jgi:sulfite reductase alpha subunit-like flavoprotein
MSGRSAIVFATEGGRSEELAGEIHKRTGIEFLSITDFPLNDIDTYSFLIFVVPSYCGGEAPDSTAEIWATLLNRTKPLTSLKFAVWGLGSSDYGETFVLFAKTLEAKLTSLGANEVTTLGITDAADVASTDLDAWVKTLNLPLV